MSSVLDTIGKAILEHAPEAFDAISKTLAAQGIDLGPMTPDAAKDFGAVESDIDAQLKRAALDAGADELELRRKPPKIHDTDPAMPAVIPPPRESQR